MIHQVGASCKQSLAVVGNPPLCLCLLAMTRVGWPTKPDRELLYQLIIAPQRSSPGAMAGAATYVGGGPTSPALPRTENASATRQTTARADIMITPVRSTGEPLAQALRTMIGMSPKNRRR